MNCAPAHGGDNTRDAPLVCAGGGQCASPSLRRYGRGPSTAWLASPLHSGRRIAYSAESSGACVLVRCGITQRPF
eukprot:7387214-Prymnesium_polylepis.1